MKPEKIRFLVGSIVSGICLYFATRHHPAMWIPAVVIGGPIGGSVCREQAKGAEAFLTAVFAIGGMVLIAWISAVAVSRQAEWWRMVFLALPIGFLGGAGIGRAFGLLWPTGGEPGP